ncbi:pyruvate kinase [Spirochaeta cellobiosiphila]|uniref:pyruvate kinase n=1 Tax=Spirochaeta cellobiosiphila TaxID=504483 RepID=UPI000402627D|nr:pyruvate kinase [Spirochaeta cellobiosiphila]
MVSKQTKIVATVSDLDCAVEHVTALYEAGMNVVRLNTAHQTHEGSLEVINNVRAVSKNIALLLDTKGPEVRTAGFEDPIEVAEGEEILITKDAPQGKGFQTNYDGFVDDVTVGCQILIDDGETALEVVAKKPGVLTAKVLNSGKIKKKKSINVPDVHLELPSITEKDKNYIKFAAEHDLDFIAHSFVRNAQDVKDVQSLLDEYGSSAKIVAKIENREGVENLDEILDHAYAIMVARGDLGIEIPAEEVPFIQKQMIAKCIERGKPVITATQMLHTMIENPRPTRAEVSDVANAIFDGTDAIMLSGETAYGKYPLEAVKTMTRIAQMVESQKPKMRDRDVFTGKNPIRNYMTEAAIKASLHLPVKAMVVDTQTGRTARIIATYRSNIPAFVKCHDAEVVRLLSLSYGIFPEYMPLPNSTDELVTKALKSSVESGDLKDDDVVVVLAGTPGRSEASNFLEINTVEMVLKGRA